MERSWKLSPLQRIYTNMIPSFLRNVFRMLFIRIMSFETCTFAFPRTRASLRSALISVCGLNNSDNSDADAQRKTLPNYSCLWNKIFNNCIYCRSIYHDVSWYFYHQVRHIQTDLTNLFWLTTFLRTKILKYTMVNISNVLCGWPENNFNFFPNGTLEEIISLFTLK